MIVNFLHVKWGAKLIKLQCDKTQIAMEKSISIIRVAIYRKKKKNYFNFFNIIARAKKVVFIFSTKEKKGIQTVHLLQN